MFEKLYKYIGKDIKTLIDRTDASYVIRLQRNRVFYVREDIMRRATNVRATLPTNTCVHCRLCCQLMSARTAPHCYIATPQVARDKLISLGSCIGKFTHSSKFRLGVGALDILSQYAKYKVSVLRTQPVMYKCCEYTKRPVTNILSVFKLNSREDQTKFVNNANLRAHVTRQRSYVLCHRWLTTSVDLLAFHLWLPQSSDAASGVLDSSHAGLGAAVG